MRTGLEIPPAADIGEAFTAKVTATNIGDSRSPAGAVTVAAPDGWTVEPPSNDAAPLAPHETRTFEFQITPSPGTEPGRYTLTARSTFGAMTYQARSGAIRVGLRNAALGKTATQKSLDWGGTPDRAVDGNIDGAFFANSVTHTAEDGSAEPWWQVDLGSDVPIHEIAVWNRTDCCSDRLSDYYVLASDHPFTERLARGHARRAGRHGVPRAGDRREADVDPDEPHRTLCARAAQGQRAAVTRGGRGADHGGLAAAAEGVADGRCACRSRGGLPGGG